MSLIPCLTDKKLITVSGSHSGIGKTLLAEYILSIIKNFSAVKITIEEFFTKVSADDEIIMVPGKDSFRLKASGALQVVWVRSPEQNLLESVEQAFSLLRECPGVLIEGNSILTYVNPDIAFFVSGGDMQTMKHSRLYALQKAHIIINNIRDNREDQKSIESSLRTINPMATIVSRNLKEKDSILPFLKTMLADFTKEH